MWRGGSRFLRPWAIGGAVWLVLSLQVLSAYKSQFGFAYLKEFWFLFCLLWAEFGFAGIYHCVRHRRGRNLGSLLLVVAVPPLLLYLLLFWEVS